MCQVGEYTFEITIDVVNMVERRTTQCVNVKELRFSKNICWSQFAYLKLRKTRSGFSIPLDFEIAKVACTLLFFVDKNVRILCIAAKDSHIFSTKNNSVFAYVVSIYLTS